MLSSSSRLRQPRRLYPLARPDCPDQHGADTKPPTWAARASYWLLLPESRAGCPGNQGNNDQRAVQNNCAHHKRLTAFVTPDPSSIQESRLSPLPPLHHCIAVPLAVPLHRRRTRTRRRLSTSRAFATTVSVHSQVAMCPPSYRVLDPWIFRMPDNAMAAGLRGSLRNPFRCIHNSAQPVILSPLATHIRI
ncbi:hypothetical protein BD289DRAFT_114399 [Coniella lustricola]|uniref:Uncharacterized protein n=1 Tax=Coniella lustricola TaxID=2025994 RepID=A0A2T2ZX77_9PEZI|nr:hypothetical protein BD289DRAFT_114399 [Coniella lustricola]